MPKRKATREKVSLEDIYRNKHFVPPKEQNLETIFEEPRQSRDGVPILTSVKKYKRYLHFDPTQNKIQKRKKKAKKCCTKLKTNNRITRSSPESSKSDDVSMYILNALGDDSTDSEMDLPNRTGKAKPAVNINHSSTDLDKDASSSDLCVTPKRNCDKSKTRVLQNQDESSLDIVDVDQPQNEETNTSDDESQNLRTDNDDENGESPRRSCCIS